MAYQNVGTPRFYVDSFEYLKSKGTTAKEWFEDVVGWEDHMNHRTPTSYPELFGLNPVIQKNIENASESNDIDFFIPTGYYKPNVERDKEYIAILNHDFSTDGPGIYNVRYRRRLGMSWAETACNNIQPIINYGDQTYTPNKGVTMLSFENDYSPNHWTIIKIRLYNSNSTSWTPNIGAISYGCYYDMPVNPDLDLSMEIQFDGYKNTSTVNGSTLTNMMYSGSPWWYESDGTKREPWAIGDSSGISKRNGRRVWNLSFSYMADKDLFASNYSGSSYFEGNGVGTDYDTNEDLTSDDQSFLYTLDDDDSFHARVLNRISHGQKFIFQPDNTNNNPDQFAICVLDQDSFKMERVAPKTYNISMKIREVW